MAKIVEGLFGLTPSQVEQKQALEQEQRATMFAGLAQPEFRQLSYGMSNLGYGLGKVAGELLGVQDPELTKAKDIASIQKELLTELGPTGISDPNKFFPLLSEKLQNAGYSDEATQISIVGANEIANWNKEQKALEIQDLQIKQGQQSLKTEIELLEERKESAIREGNIPLALRLEAELNKKLPKQKEVKLEAPQTIADRAILKSFQNDYGEVEGGKKFNEYKNKLEVNAALAKKSKDDGLSINELVKINKEVKSIVKPSVDRIKKYMDITSILDLARQGNADANAQLDRFLTTLVGDKQIGAKEVAQVVSGGSLPRRVGNSISQWLTGEKTELAYEDKDALVRELLDKAINDNELAFKSAKYQYGDLLTEKQMDQALAGLRYNRSKSPETSEELSDEELLQKYINE